MLFTKLAALKDIIISDFWVTPNNWLVNTAGPRGSANKDAMGTVVEKKNFLEVLEIICLPQKTKWKSGLEDESANAHGFIFNLNTSLGAVGFH